MGVATATGNDPPVTNEETFAKLGGGVTKGAIDDERRRKIEEPALNFETFEDVAALSEILSPLTRNPNA